MSLDLPNQILAKIKLQQPTEQDQQVFRDWLKDASEAEIQEVVHLYGDYFEHLTDGKQLEAGSLYTAIENRLDAFDQEQKPERKPIKIWPALRNIAALAAIVALTVFIYNHNRNTGLTDKLTSTHRPSAAFDPVVPGGNKAILTLSDGSTITLDSAKNGKLASQGKVKIYKSAQGKVMYDASGSAGQNGNALASNTISTPRGGQYQLVLPDGTKVWLNAASSIKFPTSFSGKERAIELTGEAYFEVAKDKAHPFIVHANDMDVKVLGTHFNVMAYKDEASTQTTLLEGSVRIIKDKTQRLIVPGEQASVSSDIKIARVNVSEVIEWKNGNFNFAHENLESIMRKISRWYDVKIEYHGAVTGEGFVGTIPRMQNITEVLNYLELTGLVHFKLVERRVIVMP